VILIGSRVEHALCSGALLLIDDHCQEPSPGRSSRALVWCKKSGTFAAAKAESTVPLLCRMNRQKRA
jgi:hypothetical protein